MENNSHTVGTVNVQELPGNSHKQFVNPGNVDFEVKYPEGYSGNRIMPEGVVNISKDAANKFENLGIGSVVKNEDPKKDTTDSNGNNEGGKPLEKMTKAELQAELEKAGIEYSPESKKADLLALLEAGKSEE